jgi:hypothetical protein
LQLINQHKITMIDGQMIGIKDKQNNIVNIDRLLGEKFIDFNDDIIGIYIPSGEILKRTKYQWFARLSDKQLVESDIYIAKELTLCN